MNAIICDRCKKAEGFPDPLSGFESLPAGYRKVIFVRWKDDDGYDLHICGPCMFHFWTTFMGLEGAPPKRANASR